MDATVEEGQLAIDAGMQDMSEIASPKDTSDAPTAMPWNRFSAFVHRVGRGRWRPYMLLTDNAMENGKVHASPPVSSPVDSETWANGSDLGNHELQRLHPRLSGEEDVTITVGKLEPSQSPSKLWSRWLLGRILEQLRSVLPICLSLIGFQTLMIGELPEGLLSICTGLLAVLFGLFIFLFGLQFGLMPIGELIGTLSSERLSVRAVLAVAGVLGVVVTIAEPALLSLQVASNLLPRDKGIFLYNLLHAQAGLLVLAVATGVGVATTAGMLRLVKGWGLKPFILTTVPITLALSVWLSTTSRREVISLAWDLGAVTTGPVTVPVIISLGVGLQPRSSGDGDADGGGGGVSGFGIVTLASLYPVCMVLILALIVPDVPAHRDELFEGQQDSMWEASPFAEMLAGTRALTPLVLLLLSILRVIIREPISSAIVTIPESDSKYRAIAKRTKACNLLILTWIGIIVFNLGLNHGLTPLGAKTGTILPATFLSIPDVAASPMFESNTGIAVALFVAWLLGFGATLAEPALNTMARVVEELTQGQLPQRLVMFAVSTGVGFGLVIGVARLIFEISIVPILLVGYTVAMLLTCVSSEDHINVAWDSAGVTTGPVTVPLVLAVGISLGNQVSAGDGFGVLACASIAPIVSMLTAGLIQNCWHGRNQTSVAEV